MIIDSVLLLALAPLLALVAGLLAWRARRARIRAALLWAPEQQVARDGRAGPWLLAIACLVAGVGAAGPRWGTTETEMEGRPPEKMQTGSAWLQPPNIKHRVTNYSDDCEVLEVVLPADFETEML